jgi:hypothetical protein
MGRNSTERCVFAKAGIERGKFAADAERLLPFDEKTPSWSSRNALAEIATGKMKFFATVDDLMADLNADN